MATNNTIARKDETMTTPVNGRMLDELRTLLCTHNEAGQHFTEWSQWYNELEEAGLIEIYRPVHESTGIPYGQEYWQLSFTDEGIEVAIDSENECAIECPTCKVPVLPIEDKHGCGCHCPLCNESL